MAHQFPGAADTLEEAHSLFDWRNWTPTDRADLDRYYEQRTNSEHVRQLLERVRAARRNHTWLHALYVGPPGCGKSTDLAWLVEEIGAEVKDEVLICHYDIGRVVGTHAVGFAEVALSMVLQIYECLEHRDGPPLDERYLVQVRTWLFGEGTSSETVTSTRQAEGGLSLLKLVKLGLSSRKVREEQVKVRLDHLLPELRSLLANLLEEVTRITRCKVLFVVDDLEKLTPVDAALALFLNHGGFFADLPCHVVFTAPSSLRLHARYAAEVLNHFVETRATLARPEQDGKKTTEFNALKNIVYRRLSPDLIEQRLVDRVVLQTGGLVAQVIDVMERALLMSMTRRESQVSEASIDQALKELSERYFAALRDEAYIELDRVERLGRAAHVERPELLHSLAILEYPDSPSEFVVHPLVTGLLERWRSGRVQ